METLSILLAFIAGAWWRHQMETFSALLAICAGNSPVPGEFPTQRPVTRSFDVYFDLRPNKRLSKQSWGWWFETQSCPLWRHRNGILPVSGGLLSQCGAVRCPLILAWTNHNSTKAYLYKSALWLICLIFLYHIIVFVISSISSINRYVKSVQWYNSGWLWVFLAGIWERRVSQASRKWCRNCSGVEKSSPNMRRYRHLASLVGFFELFWFQMLFVCYDQSGNVGNEPFFTIFTEQ